METEVWGQNLSQANTPRNRWGRKGHAGLRDCTKERLRLADKDFKTLTKAPRWGRNAEITYIAVLQRIVIQLWIKRDEQSKWYNESTIELPPHYHTDLLCYLDPMAADIVNISFTDIDGKLRAELEIARKAWEKMNVWSRSPNSPRYTSGGMCWRWE